MQTFFAFYCIDDPAHATERDARLEDHLAHVEAHLDAYMLAGPLKSEDGASAIGSLFILQAPDLDAAQCVMAADPYIAGKLYASVRVSPFVGAVGQAVGGAAWKAA
jgi:uncharacterized protein YciI